MPTPAPAVRRFAGALALPWMLLAAASSLHAAPMAPTDDDEVVERVPATPAAVRRQRVALLREPAQPALAVQVAQDALQRARRLGDPREVGTAQAALAPWWERDDAPPTVRLMRATVRQARHDFDAALSDLDRLRAEPGLPLAVAAQAELTRAGVLQVRGRLTEAREACAGLLAARFAATGPRLAQAARACLAEVDSLRADPLRAGRDLQALAAASPGDTWIALLQAEAAERRGDAAAAAAAFEAASAAPDADVYTLAAHADFLLARGRAREALAVVDRGPAGADALLLRRGIALAALGDTRGASEAADRLQARLDAARRRGDLPHEREEARLALDLARDAARAWRLAQDNWRLQREPADAVLLWRSALATRSADARRTAAALLRDWVPDPARADVRLAGLAAEVRP